HLRDPQSTSKRSVLENEPGFLFADLNRRRLLPSGSLNILIVLFWHLPNHQRITLFLPQTDRSENTCLSVNGPINAGKIYRETRQTAKSGHIALEYWHTGILAYRQAGRPAPGSTN
ncbi:MAG TPA: hypothetical protein PL012_22340, partial [Candidatus Obscuribacter sp.]|nr:hypothetical protein [Candidatus Obscuribacter sp.]